jgi:hypothetical protein
MVEITDEIKFETFDSESSFECEQNCSEQDLVEVEQECRRLKRDRKQTDRLINSVYQAAIVEQASKGLVNSLLKVIFFVFNMK